MKPLLSYYGGKQRMTPHILPIIESIPHTVYVEPFCGGAALLFAKPRREVGNTGHYTEVINDLNGLLINFYRVAKTRTGELISMIDATLYSRAEYRRAVEIYKNPSEYSDIEQAWAVFVNFNQSFVNKANGGWGVAVYGRNLASTWDERKSRLQAQCDRIKDVHIECRDALDIIKQWDSPQTLFYCDPPYPGTHCGHYSGYTTADFNMLVDTLNNIQGSFVLSNYAQDREPEGCERLEFKATVTSSGKGKTGTGRDKTRAATAEETGDRARTEVLWVKRSNSAMRPELQKLFKNQHSLFEVIK